MNKKGELSFMIKIAIGLAIGVFLILTGMSFWKVILGLLFPNISELTATSADTLSEFITELEEGENSTVLFYMDKGFVLVAFDNSRTSGSGTLNYYERPVSCFDTSCLVVCSDSDSKNSCKKSDLVKLFDFEKFEVENEDTGIVSLVHSEYVELYVERTADSVIIREVNEN